MTRKGTCVDKACPMAEGDKTTGLRTLNAVVPEEVYWHVRQCATESRLSMKEFMAEFCKGARPLQPRSDEVAEDEKEVLSVASGRSA